jgi:hypothetical protein
MGKEPASEKSARAKSVKADNGHETVSALERKRKARERKRKARFAGEGPGFSALRRNVRLRHFDY